jgi:hypothetical protein
MGVRDTNRCDATVSLNIQKFEEDKLEGRETGRWYWGPEHVVVPVVYPGPPDEECDHFRVWTSSSEPVLDAGVFQTTRVSNGHLLRILT